MDDIVFTEFRDEDLDWVLGAMIDSLKATLTPERLAASAENELIAQAKADFDRFHYKAEKPDMAMLAWKDGQRIGLVWITMQMPVHEDRDSAWLLEVFVVPEMRRHGLGKALIGKAEEWARTRGAKELWLNVGGGNRKALGLYESMGFGLETMHLCKRL